MKGKILATAILALIAVSTILTVIPSTLAATTTFGQSTQSGTTSASLNTALGARYLNTIPGQANSISAYLSYSPTTGLFGVKTSGTLNSETIMNRMRGQAFTTGVSYPVVATSIGARIYVAMEHTVKAAIYTESGQLIASSNAITLSGWVTDNYEFALTTQPILYPSTKYIIVAWSNNANGNVKLLYNTNGGDCRVADQNYQSSWPTSVTNFGSLANRNHFIWCNYQSAANVQCAVYSTDGTTRLGTTEQTTLTTATSGWTTFNFNTKPTLTANTQYVLAAWSNNPAVNLYYTGTTAQGFTGSGSSIPATLSASGTRNYNLKASTAYQTITASAGAGGTISPSGPTTVAYGASQSFSITPNTGYHVTGVTIDGTTPAGAVTSYNFPSVTSDRSIAAAFAKNTYEITVTQTAHGTIAPGTTIVNYGDSPTFSITADPQYHITDVVVDGVSVGTVATYQFTNVNAVHTITATYAITQVATSLTVACTPDTVDKSGSMITTISGTLTTSGGAPIAGKAVALTYNDGTEQPITITCTQADGSYSYTWTAPSGLPNGFYRITAAYTGDNNPYQSSTAETAMGGGGLFVVPEYALGALGAVFAMFAAFGLVKVRHKRN